MAAAAQVQVVGARKFRKACRKAGIDLKDLREAYRLAARTVAAQAKIDAPRRSGRLANTVRPGGTVTSAVIRAGTSAVPYAGPIHYGWPARNIKAQPFMVDAAHRTEPIWVDFFADEMNQAMATMAAGGVR